MKKNYAEKIIVALDVSNTEEALSLVRELKDTAIFKVGLQLFTVEGPTLVKHLHDLGKKVPDGCHNGSSNDDSACFRGKRNDF